MSLREKILAADDLPVLEINVPEWGCSVWARSMTGTERSDYEEQMRKLNKDNAPDYQVLALYLLYVLVDESGERIFSGPEDVKALSEKNSAALLRVFQQASRHNGMAAGDVEDLEKN